MTITTFPGVTHMKEHVTTWTVPSFPNPKTNKLIRDVRIDGVTEVSKEFWLRICVEKHVVIVTMEGIIIITITIIIMAAAKTHKGGMKRDIQSMTVAGMQRIQQIIVVISVIRIRIWG